MDESRGSRILAERPAAELVGREAEAASLLAAAEGMGGRGIALSGAPGHGVSELLRHVFDRLFHRGNLMPVYFDLKGPGADAAAAGTAFVRNFLSQAVAFRRRDPSIILWRASLAELAELSLPEDARWVDRIVEMAARGPGDSDGYLQECLAAPVRAMAAGLTQFVMIDSCHEAARDDLARKMLGHLGGILRQSGSPFAMGARRRFRFDDVDLERLQLHPLSFADAGELLTSIARKYLVRINDETRDLLITQLDRHPAFLRAMVLSAADSDLDLDAFPNAERVYAAEVFGGRIADVFGDEIRRPAPGTETQIGAVSLLDLAVTLGKKQLSFDAWRERLGLPEPDFLRLLEQLNIAEMIRTSSNQVEAMDENRVLADYVSVRFRLDVVGENRAALFASSVAEYLKRAVRLMEQTYKSRSAVGVRDLLSSFALQHVPRALVEFGRFRELKALADDEIAERLATDTERLRLPRVVHTVSTTDLYKPLGELLGRNCSAVGIAFREGAYDAAGEEIWIAAEITGKFEIEADQAEFWCDRLEMAAVNSGFDTYRLWLISPEGFTEEAEEVLRSRSAFGSSRRQAELLRAFIGSDGIMSKTDQIGHEYEIVVPAGGDSELIATNALEEIARRHSIGAREINQIKTAVIEASINAAEHSRFPAGRIHHRFAVMPDRIVVTVSNRGIRFAGNGESAANEQPVRRGWGLKLIRKLMDEVDFEPVDDGTRISMTKFLGRAGGNT